MPTNITAAKLLPYPEPELVNFQVVNRIDMLWDAGKKFQILSGPPGTGKTRAAEDYVSFCHSKSLSLSEIDNCRVSLLFPDFRSKVYTRQEIEDVIRTNKVRFIWDIVVLHPQYSYEDLIRGFRTEANPNGGVSLVVREGILAFIARVSEVMEKVFSSSRMPKSILIMDEINRAPIGQLFGEAFYAIDRRDKKVVTAYALDSEGAVISVPGNVLLLGTMNSIDRATAGFDFALRRRFANVSVLSSRLAVQDAWAKFGEGEKALALYDQIRFTVEQATNLSEIKNSELVLGHAYFIPPVDCDTTEKRYKWLYTSYVYQILPTLEDYKEQGLVDFQAIHIEALPMKKGLDFASVSEIDVDLGTAEMKSALA